MVMGEAADAVDLLVIGGGPGGYAAALRAAELGRRVTLVERARIGGVCLQVGCIPSKHLIETADAYDTANGILSGAIDLPLLDLEVWQKRKQMVVDGLAAEMEVRLKALAVERITGSARFTSRSRVAVQQDDGVTPFIEFRNAVIATGSRPALFAGLPADDDRVIDSTGALALTELPRNLAVIGAGSIGVELATAFAKLGVEVTVVEREDRILPEFPAFIARPVAQRLGQLGVTIHLGVSVVGLSDDGLACRFAGNDVAVPCDKVLVAVGRRPNTDGIGCDAARIPLGDDGRVVVGPDRLIPGSTIAAIGDITAGSMLAHKASAEAVVAAEALCGRRVAFDPAAIPLVVYSDPEVASAGYSRDSARADGIAAQAVTVPLAALGRAATMAAVEGFTQLVVDVDRNAVIGVHIVGPHASELICAGVLAIEMAATPDDLAATVHAHPTLSEGLHEAARRWITQTK